MTADSQEASSQGPRWTQDPGEGSQEPSSQTQPSQTQMTEVLTQNVDLTQLGDFDEGQEEELLSSPLPPYSPSAQRRVPWGRLMPCCSGSGGEAVELLPRPPDGADGREEGGGTSYLGLENLLRSDRFNEVVLGRSQKCDVVAIKPTNTDDGGHDEKERMRQNWAYGMISNRHCRIYCCLDVSGGMDVYIEDCSGNGTSVNRSNLLRRGEKRLLHSGDEICLVNPVTLRKKIRNEATLRQVLQRHAYIFVNVVQQQAPRQLLQPPPQPVVQQDSSPKQPRKKAAVDARATKSRVWPDPSPSKESAAAASAEESPSVARRQTSSDGRRVSPRRRRTAPRRIQEDYDIRETLGSGTVGEVRRAIHRQTGQQRAVKIISLGGRNRAQRFLESQAQLEVEAAILQQLEHPYVVKLVDVYVSQQAVYLVMELLHGGDLFDRIIERGKYSETSSRRVMRRLLAAVHYLHEERNIVHRDLKPENILLVSANSDVDVKLTDFGLAKAADEGLKTFCGTPQYFAPEVLRRRHTVAGRGRYGKQADMWSLGVILYVLLSGTPPFSADEMLVSEVSTNITFPAEHWEGISEEAKDLILRLLVTDPRQRLAVTAACEHAWILQPDGDSHVHPLDDPQIQRVQQRLFASPHTLSQDEKAVLAASVGDHSRRSAEKEGLVSDAPQRQDESKFPEEKEHQPCGDQPREATSSLSVAKPAPDNSVEQKKQPGKGLDFALTAASTPEPDRSPATAGSPTEVAAAQGERGKGQAEHSEVVPGAKKEADQDGPPRSRSSLRSQNAVESRRPLSPVSLNDSLQDTGLGPSRDSGGAPADALASPTAVTPSASNARRFEPVTESRVTSLELNDDEVMSEFSQQTDSIDSFASMAPPEASDIIETNQKLKDARPATTDDAESANPSSEGGKRAEKPAAAKKKSKKKQGRSKGTNKESTDSSKSSRGKKRSGGSSAKTKGGSKKQKTSSSPGKQTGGKQTTLADWFKKSS